MLNYLYIYVDAKETSNRMDAIHEEILKEKGTWIHLTSARSLLLTIDTFLEEYDRVIVDLPADDVGLACAVIIKDKVYGLSWTSHYSVIGYHDYVDLIKKEMKV